MRVGKLHDHEAAKAYPDRFPLNEDSLGIEIVGSVDAAAQSYASVTKRPERRPGLARGGPERQAHARRCRRLHARTDRVQAAVRGLDSAMEEALRRPGLPLLLLLAALSACVQAPRAPAQFSVDARGSDAGGDFCSDFVLTPAQAASFFARAHRVTAEQLHARYDRLPCWVRGQARLDDRRWSWEVRAGGTARLLGGDGEVRLLACDVCDDLLGGSKARRR